LSTPDQQLTKKLAEMKSYLERKIKEQEGEVNSLKTYLEVVDSLLAERSFRPVEIPAGTQPSQPRPSKPTTTPTDSVPVLTVDGVRIAGMSADKTNVHIVPEPGVNLDSNSAPLRSFLLGKVLDPMQAKDKEAASTGALSPDNIISYSLEQDGDRLKAIHIQNYGDDRRLLELKNAIRWTLRRMYENATAKK
jgi:hypothetical protein